MKEWILLLLAFFSVLTGGGQELRVELMKQLPLTDMSASVNPRKDRNGVACALVKVIFPKEGLKFEGNVIGDTPFKDGEYWVYLPENSKFLRVKHGDYAPLMITFEKEGIAEILSKCVYELKLNSGDILYPVKFKIFPPDAMLMVDNLQRDPIDGNAELQLSAGEHSYTATKPGFEGEGNKFFVSENGANKIIIELESKSTTDSPGENNRPDSNNDPQPEPQSSSVKTEEDSIVMEMKRAYQQYDYLKAYELALSISDNPEAQFMIGHLYYCGMGGVKHDTAKALEWFQKAIDNGNTDAMISMAEINYNGWIVPKDYSKAMEWYKKAADKGNPEAMVYIGALYETGEGVNKDMEEAQKWYKKAVDKGGAEIMVFIGDCYYTANIVPLDYAQAMEWYMKAVNKGNPEAMRKIGGLYFWGDDVVRNYTKALDWYSKAADNGDAEAMYLLGKMYEKGEGVEENIAEAKKWYKKGTELYHPYAKEALERLEKFN